MKKMHANLLGKWVNLHDDPEALVFDSHPDLYIQECLQELFDYDYVNILYKGIAYRIHPSYIQVVTE